MRTMTLRQRRKKRLKELATWAERSRVLALPLSQSEKAELLGVTPATIRSYQQQILERVMSNDDLFAWVTPPRPLRTTEAEQAEQVYQARLRGESYHQIAKDLDISTGAAMKMFTTKLERLISDDATNSDAIRRLEVERLDAMLAEAWKIIAEGGTNALFAMDRVLKIMDRRAKYLGLDAPMKVNIEQRLRKVAEDHGLEIEEVMGEVRAILAEQS